MPKADRTSDRVSAEGILMRLATTRFPESRRRRAVTQSAQVQTYLADVLTKLVNLWPASRLDELMPWAWDSSNRIAAPAQVAA
jgi:IS66 C-terminal element